jgi:hypothetical protein
LFISGPGQIIYTTWHRKRLSVVVAQQSASKIYITRRWSTDDLSGPLPQPLSIRCCYIKLDFATAAPQNGYNTYRRSLSFIRKPYDKKH